MKLTASIISRLPSTHDRSSTHIFTRHCSLTFCFVHLNMDAQSLASPPPFPASPVGSSHGHGVRFRIDNIELQRPASGPATPLSSPAPDNGRPGRLLRQRLRIQKFQQRWENIKEDLPPQLSRSHSELFLTVILASRSIDQYTRNSSWYDIHRYRTFEFCQPKPNLVLRRCHRYWSFSRIWCMFQHPPLSDTAQHSTASVIQRRTYWGPLGILHHRNCGVLFMRLHWRDDCVFVSGERSTDELSSI
jgi:hypothetical protein